MYAWSTVWYTTSDEGARIQHTGGVGEYSQSDTYGFHEYHGSTEATGLVFHPTALYFYVSGTSITECYANTRPIFMRLG